MITAKRLIQQDQLLARRRGASSGIVFAAGAGILGAVVLTLLGVVSGVAEARSWWLIAVILGNGGIVLASPWRFYFRQDTTGLARLPVGGRALFELGAWLGLLGGARMGLALFLATMPTLWQAGWVTGLRSSFLVIWSCGTAIAIAPCAATVAAVLAVSQRAERLFREMTGESAPRIAWIAVVPALGGLLVGAAILLLAPWTQGVSTLGPAWMIVLVGSVLSAAGYAWGRAVSRHLPRATQIIASLDQTRLAHVELETAGRLEASWGRVAGRAVLIFLKDVASMRRRHPAYFLWCSSVIAVMWGIAIFAEPDARTQWTALLAVILVGYTVITGYRLGKSPIEHARLVRTLPFTPHEPVRAKLTYVVGRLIALLAIGIAPAIARGPSRLGLALIAVTLASAAVLAVLHSYGNPR